MNPGEMITPTLRLAEQLGVGGMGSVWAADNLTLSTRVAVKFMAREMASSPDLRARFAREAAAASQVKSPHVVQMFDHGLTAEGVPFISMELLEGEDLARRIRRVGRMSPGDVSTILTQSAKALSKAHERGIVHRDIKPENIFLCASDDDEIFVKVLDFGIAKVSDGVTSSTRTGAVMGTAYYMSPEQIVGSKQVSVDDVDRGWSEPRAAILSAAAMVATFLAAGVGGGGCAAVTGVNDYESCNQSDVSACEPCCATAFPGDKYVSLETLRQCACAPDKCQTPCSADFGGDNFCHNPLAGFSADCDNCLGAAIRTRACLIDTGNPYNECLGGCGK